MPIVNKGRTEGAVRLTQSVDAIDREIRRDQYALIGVGALALLLGLVVAWFVAGSLARPLRRLAVTARRVGGGDLDVRAEVEGSAEQQEVARAFNTMADRLTHSLDAQRDFVANASHQLRTPLTGLRLRVEAASWRPTTRRAGGAGGGRGRDRAAGAPDHQPAHARVGRRAGAAQRAGRPRAAAREAEERWRAAPSSEGRHVACEPAGRGDRPSAVATTRDEPRQPDRERARARAGGQQRHDHLGRRLATRPSSPFSTTAPASRPRMPRRRSSASSAAPRGPSGAAAPGSASRSSERSPAAGAAPPRCGRGPRAVRERRSACRSRRTRTPPLPSPYLRRPTVRWRCAIRMTTLALALAGLLVAVAVGLAANAIASRSFTPGVDALPAAGSLAPPAAPGAEARDDRESVDDRQARDEAEAGDDREARDHDDAPRPQPRPRRRPTITAAIARGRTTRPARARAARNDSSGHGSGHGSDD